MKITKNSHVLAVHDLKKSARYYQDVLGFQVREVGDPGWRFAERDNCRLMLGECTDAIDPRDLGDHSYFAYIHVDDIDAIYEEFIGNSASIRQPPKDKPWGMREFHLETIDGHRITFGQEIGG